MIKIQASDAINLLVETMLPRFSDAGKGLFISIDCILRHPETRKEKRNFVSFIFSRPNNYVKVFCTTSSKHISRFDLNPNDFEFLCDHDSCWRDAISSKLSEVYFKLTEDAVIAPIKFEDNSSISCFCPNYLKIEIGLDETDKHGYKKKIISLNTWKSLDAGDTLI